jgi:hypothetical protein
MGRRSTTFGLGKEAYAGGHDISSIRSSRPAGQHGHSLLAYITMFCFIDIISVKLLQVPNF